MKKTIEYLLIIKWLYKQTKSNVCLCIGFNLFIYPLTKIKESGSFLPMILFDMNNNASNLITIIFNLRGLKVFL